MSLRTRIAGERIAPDSALRLAIREEKDDEKEKGFTRGTET
jgi:hypothetical protein